MGNQSVLAACKQQLCDLDSLALDSLLMLYIPTEYTCPARHTLSSLNVAKYFIPFWSEHILYLGKINTQEAHAWAWGLVRGTWPKYILPQVPALPKIDHLESAITNSHGEGLSIPKS